MKIENNSPVIEICEDDSYKVKYAYYLCIGGRPEEQDCLGFHEVNGHCIFTVCDGMGGAAGGRLASELAVRTLLDTLSLQLDKLGVEEAIEMAVGDANRAVYDKALQTPELRGMGTTVTVLVLDDEAAYVTHVGDSRVYQLRRGKKIFRTFDHSMVFEQVAKKRLTEEEARVHPRSNVLSRALGVQPDAECDVEKLSYKTGDRFVLCCDGVWNAFPEPEVIRLFTSTDDLKETVTEIYHLVEDAGAEKGGLHDNHTMIIVETDERSSYRNTLFDRIKKRFISKKHKS